jgi:hypothetical protein
VIDAVETPLVRLFQKQVKSQCQAVLGAAARLDAALSVIEAEGRPTDAWRAAMDDVWIAIHDLLNAAANIGKALWGAGGTRETERADLRASLSVSDTSPLKHFKMRNNFEHFDERLDTWWNKSVSHFHVDRAIGPMSAPGGPVAETDIFRALDPATMEIGFWGQRFNLREITAEVQRLLPLVTAEAAKPLWED